ncbi:nucleoside-diphosphate sugar epimerase/dehydratase [Roseobacter sp.]|uniref:polysaccharide biosynthesis protein n=1 Tax=Roseobacter sp. TaxID=1907202 RepID=UPI0032983DF3
MMRKIALWLIRLPRFQKRLLQIVTDVILLTASFIAAMALRLDSFEFMWSRDPWIAISITLPVTISIFIRSGFYRAVVRYISSRALKTVFWGVLASSVFLLVASQVSGLFVPRSVPGIYALLAFFSVGGVRFVLRELFFSHQRSGRTPVLIYGAGASGRDLAKVLGEGREYTAIGFVDRNKALHGSDIMGLRVYPPARLPQLLADHGIAIVMLALPRLMRSERKEIIDTLAEYAVRVQTVPELDEIVGGRAQVSEIREVAPEDLLGRDPIAPDQALMTRNISGKVVLVTGAGGSIGSELCWQIISQRPKRLIVFDVSEAALYRIDMDLREGGAINVTAILGSVRDPNAVQGVFERFGIDTVYHAAAYKHVPLVEENCAEGFLNNAVGTQTVLKAALAHECDAFILISTDKAVRPTNVMGATKRMAELLCQAHAATKPKTCISMVRFGNVLGSSGSVVPRFRAQIASGGPVTVTHPEITRYFMSVPEAAQLVIQAGAMAQGGDVFVLDMGAPVRIHDLADRMIRLSGLKPYVAGQGHGDIQIAYTELRPGEKLYEELLINETARSTAHPRIMTSHEEFLPMDELIPLVEDMVSQCRAGNHGGLQDCLRNAPTGYPAAQTASPADPKTKADAI